MLRLAAAGLLAFGIVGLAPTASADPCTSVADLCVIGFTCSEVYSATGETCAELLLFEQCTGSVDVLCHNENGYFCPTYAPPPSLLYTCFFR